MSYSDYLTQVENDIRSERERAEKKHGKQVYLSDIVWNAIASEEAGEATKAALDESHDLYSECIQAAAMYQAWAEHINTRGLIGWRKEAKK